MRNIWANSVYCSPLLPCVSLDAIRDRVLDDTQETASADILDPTSGPDEVCQSNELNASVAAFVQSLPLGQQEMVFRLFWIGESQASIAAEFGVSKMTISKQVKKIRAQGMKALAAFESYSDLH